MSALVSILSIYSFIFLGYIAKKIFTSQIDEKTLILISIYFMQPILTFWGLTRIPIDPTLILTPIIYIITITFTLIIMIFISKFIFDEQKNKSIFIVTALIGNTGNLGIPLGIAVFGEQSIPYTSIINIANIFFIYTVGIYFFSKGNFTFKESFFSMIKIPILWFSILALAFNYFHIPINLQIDKALQMGAYAAIVIQLLIFGIYLAKVNTKEQNYKLTVLTSSVKLIILPILGIIFSFIFSLDSYAAAILVLSLSTPLAVNNVNIAALYGCKPYLVTNVILFSTILFLLIFYFDLHIIKSIFGV
ncbi:MAG TPA: hypothetical protein EYG97_04810 [Arcobacter sp.]|nr:hypothetical protein [Arcobacter sp.]HIP56327.1 hypothetical protein [Arcobacter sp.]